MVAETETESPTLEQSTLSGSPRYVPEFAAILRSIRARMRITLEEAGNRCGMNRVAISELERGKRQPTHNTIRRIVHGLKIDPSEFFPDTPPPVLPKRPRNWKTGRPRKHVAASPDETTEAAHAEEAQADGGSVGPVPGPVSGPKGVDAG